MGEDTFPQRIQQTVREIVGAGEPDAIALWEFPEEDFPAWIELTGASHVLSYGAYAAMLAAVQADQERQGRRVRRARFGVDRMRAALVRLGWPNTPDHRAAIVAGVAAGEL